MPASTVAATKDEIPADTPTVSAETDTSSLRVAKKQKTAAVSSAVKAVKAVDPAIILQRRDAVQQRVLKLESKLAKDRALLAKYTVPYTANGSDESDEKATGTGDDE